MTRTEFENDGAEVFKEMLAQDDVELLARWGGSFLGSNGKTYWDGKFTHAVTDTLAGTTSPNIAIICCGNDIRTWHPDMAISFSFMEPHHV